MVSLISWFIDFLRLIKVLPRQDTVQVSRMLPAKVINANLLGLSMALFLVLAAMSFQYSTISATQPWFNSLILLALFLTGSYYLGGFFTVIVALSYLVISAPSAGSFSYSIKQLAYWNLLGYGFGAIFATLYNDLVFLYIILFEREKIKWYAYFRDKKRENEFNIIKSPIESQEKAVQAVLNQESDLKKREKLKERKLYNFKIGEPQQPYTILFVANPYIQKRKTKKDDPDRFELDPIIDDPELFYHSIDRALRSFETNEVLGNPDIWSRVRVISIFDSKLKTRSANEVALLEEFQGNLEVDGTTPLNLIDPLPDMNDKVEKMLAANQGSEVHNILSIENGDIDVIFGMSASLTHDRSTAHFSDYEEKKDVQQPSDTPAKGDADFTFHPDPFGRKAGDINVHEKFRTGNGEIKEGEFRHEQHVKQPGRVALNVIGAIQRTFIHEFAHAMSSMINGAITDEYADVFALEESSDKNGDPETPIEPIELNENPPFYVNRLERKIPPPDKLLPVHKVFADYNRVVFHSDLEHPSAKENWRGYFPDRDETGVSCIMDRFTGYYHFDELISNFMYDRLAVKVQREKKL